MRSDFKLFQLDLFSRKAEPLCRKLNSGYHQYSRVDVRTRESSVDNFVRETDIMMDNHLDNESDNEDDPTKLLDQWLGELNTLKKVRYFLIIKSVLIIMK